MKKLFYVNLIIICLIFSFALSSSAAILPPNSKAFTGRITKIFKDKTKRNILIKIQKKNQSLVLRLPQNDPLKLMASIKEYRGKIVTVIYSFPDMTIINIKKKERKKPRKF